MRYIDLVACSIHLKRIFFELACPYFFNPYFTFSIDSLNKVIDGCFVFLQAWILVSMFQDLWCLFVCVCVCVCVRANVIV